MSIDLSLDRLVQLLPLLPYTRPTLHIAGTNGKGSVSALLTSILMASDPPLRVGRFNSPHLVTVLDSITIDNQDISREVYNRVRKEVEDVDREQGTKLTGFEVLTMAALRIFETEGVDVVVLEVGMGGRLDATNIVPSSCILVSALTAVDLDHQAFLGDTVALIAKEKAGIAREGKPFVLGRQTHAEVEGVVKEVVGKVGGTVIPALQPIVSEVTKPTWSIFQDTTATGPPRKRVKFHLGYFDAVAQARLPLHGAHQLDNLGTALTVIDSLLASSEAAVETLELKKRITRESIVRGVENAKWAGRLSFHNIAVPSQSSSTFPLVVLADGAHNPASAKTLGSYVSELFDLTAESIPPSDSELSIPITYILSLSHSPPKTPLQTLSPILPPSAHSPKTIIRPSVALLPFSPPQGMPWVKPVPVEIMRDTVKTLIPGLPDADLWVASEGEGNADLSLQEALKWAARKQESQGRGLVVLAGSLYLVADFYRLIEKGF